MYFIRRFLDKEYIKTGIIYTGGLHLCDIVYILTKYFNFQLTNIYYHHKTFRLGKIKKLSIKNLEYLKILANNLLTYDENLEATQCVNLFNFPANFT
jgi:hypothetical protein